MKFQELIEKASITQTEAARILKVSNMAISKRMLNPNSEAKVSEMEKIEQATGKSLYNGAPKYDQVQIKYIQIPGIPDKIIKSPFVKERLQFDREIVENAWNRIPENQRIIKMRGDKMETGLYPLRNNDILMVDISQTNVADSGIYLYSTEVNGELEIFINNVTKRPDGALIMSYFNPKYQEIIYTPQELNNMNFKVIARVVKNLSLTI